MRARELAQLSEASATLEGLGLLPLLGSRVELALEVCAGELTLRVCEKKR